MQPVAVPAAGDGPAWEDRQSRGFQAALVETTRQVMAAPTAFFAGMPPRGGLGDPLLYGILVGSLAFVLMIACVLGAGSLFEWVAPSPAAASGARPLAIGETLLAFGFWSLATPVAMVVILFLEAGLTHLLLMLLGGAREPFEATLRVSCYSRAVTLVLAVPVVGWVAGPVWLVVVRILGLAAAQRCGGGRATAAVLLPPLLCCCVQVVAYVAIFGLAALALLAGASR